MLYRWARNGVFLDISHWILYPIALLLCNLPFSMLPIPTQVHHIFYVSNNKDILELIYCHILLAATFLLQK